jgi:hypothetical protein
MALNAERQLIGATRAARGADAVEDIVSTPGGSKGGYARSAC